MSHHNAKITWNRGSAAFDYESYPKDHTWSFDSVSVPASAAPEYRGSESRVAPGQAFIASLSSCHMLTFLAIAAKRRLVVDSYIDEAVGFLEENDSGVLSITRVILKPEVTFEAGMEPSREALAKLHHSAHKHCFIVNSVKTDVEIEL